LLAVNLSTLSLWVNKLRGVPRHCAARPRLALPQCEPLSGPRSHPGPRRRRTLAHRGTAALRAGRGHGAGNRHRRRAGWGPWRPGGWLGPGRVGRVMTSGAGQVDSEVGRALPSEAVPSAKPLPPAPTRAKPLPPAPSGRCPAPRPDPPRRPRRGRRRARGQRGAAGPWGLGGAGPGRAGWGGAGQEGPGRLGRAALCRARRGGAGRGTIGAGRAGRGWAEQARARRPTRGNARLGQWATRASRALVCALASGRQNGRQASSSGPCSGPCNTRAPAAGMQAARARASFGRAGDRKAGGRAGAGRVGGRTGRPSRAEYAPRPG
jgi:hypothetical protein